MFTDYYALFEIVPTATTDEVKKAYKTQALKWHPDKNPNTDTTERMRLIIVAYTLLMDKEKRAAYDIEYSQFINTASTFAQSAEMKDSESQNFTYSFYDIGDEKLKEYIQKVKQYANSQLEIVVDELKGSLTSAGAAATGCFTAGFQGWLIGGLITTVIAILTKTCN
ncbi:MAG: J domain-containing protein [Niabella sp.]